MKCMLSIMSLYHINILLMYCSILTHFNVTKYIMYICVILFYFMNILGFLSCVLSAEVWISNNNERNLLSLCGSNRLNRHLRGVKHLPQFIGLVT